MRGKVSVRCARAPSETRSLAPFHPADKPPGRAAFWEHARELLRSQALQLRLLVQARSIVEWTQGKVIEHVEGAEAEGLHPEVVPPARMRQVGPDLHGLAWRVLHKHAGDTDRYRFGFRSVYWLARAFS